MGIDQRRDQRSKVRIAVSYETIDDFLTDYTANVSIGGIFLITDTELQKSHQIRLQMKLPDGDMIHAVGTVQWLSDGRGGPKGVGVHFDVISERDRRKILQLQESWPEE
jgi:uncharacterized protein (TIGR02266 family)